MNIHVRDTQRAKCLCVRQKTGWISTPLVLSSVGHLVLRQPPPPPPTTSPSPFKVLSLFRASIVCGRWKCLYLTQIIGMSFLTASVQETIPWPRNGNKPLVETSDKGRTISHWMCVNMRLCVCVHSLDCARSCRPTCMCQYVCICLSVCDGVPQILSG